jgi:hypothetical protein
MMDALIEASVKAIMELQQQMAAGSRDHLDGPVSAATLQGKYKKALGILHGRFQGELWFK